MAPIPLAGIQRAPLGTALALVLSIPYLSLVMRWQLGFSHWPGRGAAAALRGLRCPSLKVRCAPDAG